ncbi:MAG: hypothetical protein RBR16_14200 [Syntrophus sp. (in: bacteria)]|nr:hypothetical protein [Syntrophus sp. (in: bacteria)]
MPSKTSIVNLALSRLGQPPITDIDEGTVTADKFKAVWDDIRDFVLATHPWNFAVKRASLARLAETPDFKWSYYYQLPGDCLRVTQLGEQEDEYLWEIEAEGKLATDEAEANIEYIARITEEGRYSPGFVNALAYRLAAEKCFDLTGRLDLAKNLLQLWPQELAAAISFDSQEKGPLSFTCEAWLDARR